MRNHTRIFIPIAGLTAAFALAANLQTNADHNAAGGFIQPESFSQLPMCFPEHMTEAELTEALKAYGLRPPSSPEDPAQQRFVHDSVMWNGGAGYGPSGQAAPANLTYSFPDDGVQWGLASIHTPSVGPNGLNAELMSTFGDLDRGREFIRQSLAAWAKHTGVTYSEVADDNAPMDDFEFHVPSRGDIRIGGADATGASFLAYNAFPSSTGGATVGGGDMYIATNRFNFLNFNDPSDHYRTLRNTVAHENGHGLGFFHVVPCTQTKLMEPQVSTAFDMLSMDDIRNGQHNYGDRYAGNHLLSDAHDIGDLAPPAQPPRAFAEAMLSLNGAFGPNNTHTDWFRFRLSAAQPITVIANPLGGPYQSGTQTTSCNGSFTNYDASLAGDLLIEMVDLNSGVSWISNNFGPGGNEIIVPGVIGPGDYSVRITDIGPNSNQDVQLYALWIQAGPTPLPPTAFAGIDKRVRANEPCWLIGHMNSHANDPGATIVAYDWDTDGDGHPDMGSPSGEIPVIYPSSGTYPVTLFVADSNGQSDTHTINVTVFDGLTQILNVSPASAYRGQTVTAVIDGANFNIPTTAALSGTGWTTTNFNAIDPLGLMAEVEIQIDPNAAPGFRDVRVTNADGADTLAGAFEILICIGDLNGDGIVDTADLGMLISNFGLTVTPWTSGDFNGDGIVDTADLGLLIANFGNPC